jgi:hypothetical protein
MVDTNDISWQVVENGLDYLRSTIEQLSSDDESSPKYATLHAFASVETLLKARLARDHWTLALADVGGTTKAAYLAGDFRSVTTTEALKRLKDLVGVEIGEKELRSIKSLERLRNRATHFSLYGENPISVKATVSAALDFLLRFIDRELLPGAPDAEAVLIANCLDDVRNELGKIATLVKHRLNSLYQKISTAEVLLKCPRCEQSAFVLNRDEQVHCLFCLDRPDAGDAAEDYMWATSGITSYEVHKNGGEWPVHQCLSCGEETLIEGLVAINDASIHWACFACGFVGDELSIDRCVKCGAITDTGVGDVSICSECASDLDEL